MRRVVCLYNIVYENVHTKKYNTVDVITFILR